MKLQITKIPYLNYFVLHQTEEGSFFIGTPDKIVISISSLAIILKFLIVNKMMSKKVLEGILVEVSEIEDR